jgi:hypothetical protein
MKILILTAALSLSALGWAAGTSTATTTPTPTTSPMPPACGAKFASTFFGGGPAGMTVATAGNNRLLVVQVDIQDPAVSVVTATCDGSPMTLLRRDTGASYAIETWYKVGPASGVVNAQFSYSGVTVTDLTSFSMQDVDQASPFGASGFAYVSSGAYVGVTLAATAPNSFLVSTTNYDAANPATVGAPMNGAWEGAQNGMATIPASFPNSPGGSQVLSATLAAPGQLMVQAFEIRSAACAGSPVPTFSVTSTLSNTPTVTPTGTPQGSSGFCTVTAAAYSNPTGLLPLNGNSVAVPVSFSDFFIPTKFWIWVSSWDGVAQARVALYSDAGGVPGALVADYGPITPFIGLVTAQVPSQAPLAPGQYWLAMQCSSPNLVFATNTAGAAKAAAMAWGAFPGSFPSSTGISGSPVFQFGYCTALSPTPSMTPTFYASGSLTPTAGVSTSPTPTMTWTRSITPTPTSSPYPNGATGSPTATVTWTTTPTRTPPPYPNGGAIPQGGDGRHDHGPIHCHGNFQRGPHARQTFTLWSPKGGDCSLTIYGSNGRLLRRLFSGHMDANIEMDLAWGCEDGRGAALESGVYFAAFKDAAGDVHTEKILIVR